MWGALAIGVGIWWSANTVAHHFIHRPFFRSRGANAAVSAGLSLTLGFPQTLWRRRHLAHHAGGGAAVRLDGALLAELVLVAAFWLALAALAPPFFAFVYLPGYALGLGLCWLQGHYEHARGTTSHYGRLYNVLFMNDGYHVEHHARPCAHWTELAARPTDGAPVSRWPPVLRWLDGLTLEGLERWALSSPRLQRFLLASHARAFRRLLPGLEDVRHVKVVGGGLFPRTALVLRVLRPELRLTIVDRSAESLDTARPFLAGDARTSWVRQLYTPPLVEDADLLVIPLAYDGDRESFYRRAAVPTLVHDWIWRRRGRGVVVSWLLLKRINLVRP
jgi:hypothetical protein